MPNRPIGDVAKRDTLRASSNETVLEVARRMAERRDGCTLICDGNTLQGIFAEHDLLVRVVAKGLDPATTAISKVMTPRPDSVDSATPVKEAIRLMDACGFHHLPVTKDGEILGTISLKDLPLAEIANMRLELDDRHNLAERMR